MSDTSDWKGQYFGFLNKPRWSEVRLEDARLLKEQNLPPSLYKHASFWPKSAGETETLGENVAGQKWTLVNLKDQVVSLRPPFTFNDPYDSCLSFTETALLNDLIVKSGRKPLEGSPLADKQDAQNLPLLPPPENALEEEYQAGWKKGPEAFGPYPSVQADHGQSPSTDEPRSYKAVQHRCEEASECQLLFGTQRFDRHVESLC